MEIELWENTRGESPVAKFIENQEPKTRKKILWVIDRLEEEGIKLLFTNFMKKLQGYKIHELVIPFRGVFYRIFFVIRNHKALLIHAFKKKTNHTPRGEISITLKRIDLLKK